jgi:2-dehydro-3-deoxygluconokinase
VLTLGESMVIVVAERGPLETAAQARLSTAGAEGNVAIGLSRLGAVVTWLGRVGDDAPGRRVIRDLRSEGVDAQAILDASSPTGALLKERRSPGRSSVTYYRSGSAGSRLCPDDLAAVDFSAVGMLHVTGITLALSPSAREAVREAVRRANDAGVPVSFDVNHRSSLWKTDDFVLDYRWVVERSTIVFAGEDEAHLVEHGATSIEECASMIARRGPAEVIIKRGADGCLAFVDGQFTSHPAVPVDVVDTVGAGDAFVAGYLVERLAASPLSRRLQTAVACGALACTVANDWEGAPRWADIASLTDTEPVAR